MGEIIRTPEADRDLRQIASRIAEDNLTAALEWLQKFEAVFPLLAGEPELGEKIQTQRWGQVRRRAIGVYSL
jgi:plasmid stabilization system protein ParE